MMAADKDTETPPDDLNEEVRWVHWEDLEKEMKFTLLPGRNRFIIRVLPTPYTFSA